ncbi:MAG: serine acetyltransferase [Deltaproteobacteria bacterium]|nr:serine acetyltransferase [Deltaproteobacteria bacterium]
MPESRRAERSGERQKQEREMTGPADIDKLIQTTAQALSETSSDSVTQAGEQGFPEIDAVVTWTEQALELLLKTHDAAEIRSRLESVTDGLQHLLRTVVLSADLSRESVTTDFLESLVELRKIVAEDVEAAYAGDPAAKSFAEIILSYPSIKAVTIQRVAHVLFESGVRLLPRIMTEYAHQATGIDIHPGARIGRSFFIDHGTGVVIGETTDIGDRVKLYQGVTLGALSFDLDKDGNMVRGQKRHPTIEDDVTIYAEATILGGQTVIGKGSVIGGNVWLTDSVTAGSKVIVEPTFKRIR